MLTPIPSDSTTSVHFCGRDDSSDLCEGLGLNLWGSLGARSAYQHCGVAGALSQITENRKV